MLAAMHRTHSKVKREKQLLIFLCETGINDETDSAAILFSTPPRTLKHALTFSSQHNRVTSSVIISDQNQVIDLNKGNSGELSKKLFINTKNSQQRVEVASALPSLAANSFPLPARPKQFTRALIIAESGKILAPDILNELHRLLMHHMQHEGMIRIQVCNHKRSGILAAIPQHCLLSMPDDASAISMSDTRAIDFNIGTKREFDALKMYFSALLKNQNSLDTVIKKIPEALALGSYRYNHTCIQHHELNIKNIILYVDGNNILVSADRYTLEQAAQDENIEFIIEFFKIAKIRYPEDHAEPFNPILTGMKKGELTSVGCGLLLTVLGKNKQWDVMLIVLQQLLRSMNEPGYQKPSIPPADLENLVDEIVKANRHDIAQYLLALKLLTKEEYLKPNAKSAAKYASVRLFFAQVKNTFDDSPSVSASNSDSEDEKKNDHNRRFTSY